MIYEFCRDDIPLFPIKNHLVKPYFRGGTCASGPGVGS